MNFWSLKTGSTVKTVKTVKMGVIINSDRIGVKTVKIPFPPTGEGLTFDTPVRVMKVGVTVKITLGV